MTGTRRHGARGQATVEFALVMPLLVLFLLLLVQVALVVRSNLLVVHAAREGARAAAVDGRPDAVRAAILAAPGLDPGRLRWTVGARTTGRPVRVTVRYRVPTEVPLVGRLLGEPEVSASMSMLAEPDEPGEPDDVGGPGG